MEVKIIIVFRRKSKVKKRNTVKTLRLTREDQVYTQYVGHTMLTHLFFAHIFLSYAKLSASVNLFFCTLNTSNECFFFASLCFLRRYFSITTLWICHKYVCFDACSNSFLITCLYPPLICFLCKSGIIASLYTYIYTAHQMDCVVKDFIASFSTILVYCTNWTCVHIHSTWNLFSTSSKSIPIHR